MNTVEVDFFLSAVCKVACRGSCIVERNEFTTMYLSDDEASVPSPPLTTTTTYIYQAHRLCVRPPPPL